MPVQIFKSRPFMGIPTTDASAAMNETPATAKLTQFSWAVKLAGAI